MFQMLFPFVGGTPASTVLVIHIYKQPKPPEIVTRRMVAISTMVSGLRRRSRRERKNR